MLPVLANLATLMSSRVTWEMNLETYMTLDVLLVRLI